MEIDHIGYAVKRIDRAIREFEKLGYSFEPDVEDTDRNVRIAFGENCGYRIELVAPLDKGKDSPVDAYIGKIGAVPYHICYKTKDLDEVMETLGKQGFKVIIPPAKAIAFGGKQVVFMMNAAMGLMEIVETD